MHQINKDGLDDIIANQRLKSTMQRPYGFGGEAVRATIGPGHPVGPNDRPVIEFTTDVPPCYHPNGMFVYWRIPEGDYLPIRLIKVYGPGEE
jgi:hypothetical protein